MNSVKKLLKLPLYIQILIGMAAGILLGFVAIWFDAAPVVKDWIQPWGQLFIRLLQLIAVPLVFISLIKGITGLKDISKFSRLGLKTIGIYICTTVIAVLVGLSMGLIVQPGNLVEREQVAHLAENYQSTVEQKQIEAEVTQGKGPLNFLNDIVPNNFFQAAGDNSRMLQVIFFAIFFAMAALALPSEKIVPVIKLFDSLNDIVLRMVEYIIMLAPYM